MNASKKEKVCPDVVDNSEKLDMHEAYNEEVTIESLAPMIPSANASGNANANFQDSWGIEAFSDLPSAPQFRSQTKQTQRRHSDTLPTLTEPEQAPAKSTKKQGKLPLFGRRRVNRRRSDGDFGIDSSTHSQRSTSSEYQGPQPLGPNGLPLKGCLSSHSRRLSLDDDSISGSEHSSRSKTKLERRVSFTKIDVREYERTVGDHPCVEAGPPLSLGWKYSEYPGNCIEVFEKEKLTKTREIAVAPSPEVRAQLLRGVVPDHEIQRALADVEQTRRNRNETRATQDLQKIEEISEAAKRKFRRFLKGKSKEAEEQELWEAAHKLALEKAKKEISFEDTTPPSMVNISSSTTVDPKF